MRLHLCAMCDGGCYAGQLVHIFNHRTGCQQVRNKEELKGQEEGHTLQAITKLSQDSPAGRIFENQVANHHSETGGQISVLREDTVLILICLALVIL